MMLDENDSSSHRRLRVLAFLSPASVHDAGRECGWFSLPFPNEARTRVVPLMSVRPLPLNRPVTMYRHGIRRTAASNYRDTVITGIKNRIFNGTRRTRVPGCQVEFFGRFIFQNIFGEK